MDSKTFAVRDALQCANSSQKDLLEVNLFENYLTDCAGKVCLLLQTWFISGPPVSLNALTATASGRVLHSQNIAVFVVVPQGGVWLVITRNTVLMNCIQNLHTMQRLSDATDYGDSKAQPAPAVPKVSS